MTDFKAKMHQIRFWLGLRTKPRSGSLQHSPDPLAGFGAASRQGERLGWGRGGKEGGEGREGEVEGGKARAPKLLLNQGPSEPCYATGLVIVVVWSLTNHHFVYTYQSCNRQILMN